MTRKGIIPLEKKLEEITNTMAPTSKKGMNAIIEIVNYYQNMCTERLHILQPITRMTSKNVKFKWTDTKQK